MGDGELDGGTVALCPNCGEENPDKAKFCLECATPLQAAPPPQAEERKVVSVLFVDLVGFTARSHNLDPEDVRAALQPYHRLLKTEIERFGGTVEKFIGDAVMAVFGAPVAHEDDAERAVRAALRITEAIEEPNEWANLGLSVRAAVNTGEVLVNLSARPQAGEGMVTGDVVNTASRLQSVAPVNGVVAGEITFRSTKELIDYEELDPVELKGKPEPIAVWRAVSARSRFGFDTRTRYRTPFIGRDLDLATLKTAYQRTLRESLPQLVTIVGEPGVGKSRLLAEFMFFCDEQSEFVTWRLGRSLPYGDGITFWALGEIVKAQARVNGSDSPEVASRKLASAIAELVSDEGDRVWLHARLAPLVGVSTTGGGSPAKEESFSAWLRFLEAIASRGPLVVVFEDLHWADAPLLEFIEHLMEWSTGVPIFVVGTARPELFEKHLHWAGGNRNATTISLSALTDPEIGQLISVLLSKAVLPAEIHAALLERAGGNPLYAEEFIRMLSDRGLLQQRGRTLALDPDADVPMPENVHALIAARLDTLSPVRKSLLQDAAVVGKVFWSGALAARGGSDDTTVRRSLQELVRKELVRPTRTSSIEGEHEYSFWHALIRDVAYGSIPRSRRAEAHASVLRWIEAVTHGRDEEFAEVLAHHAELAGDVERTARYAMLAGHRNRRVFAAEEAIRWYERALSAAQDLPPNITRVLVPEIAHSRGEALEQLGRFEEAQADYEDALAIARSSGRAWLEATLLAALTHILALQDRFLDARAMLPSALRAARAAGMEDLEARLLFTAGSLAWGQGDLTLALSSHEHALHIAEEARDVEGEAFARHGLAETLCLLGPLEVALTHGRRAQELWRSLGQRPMEHRGGHVLGCLYVLMGQPGEAQLAIDNAARGQEELGQRRCEPLALAARVMAELSRGDLGAALGSATAGVEDGKDLGGPRTELVALLLRIMVLSELSAGSLAEQDLSAAESLKARIGGFFEPPLVSAQGWFELQRGRPSEAAGTFAHARREAEAGLFYRLICGGLEVRAREAARQETHLRDAAKWLLDAAAGSSPAHEALALWALARADQMEGDMRAAHERASSALELAQSVCDLTVVWRACSVVAATSWSLGDAGAATHARDMGREILSSMASSVGDVELRNLFLGRPDIANFRAAADS